MGGGGGAGKGRETKIKIHGRNSAAQILKRWPDQSVQLAKFIYYSSTMVTKKKNVADKSRVESKGRRPIKRT